MNAFECKMCGICCEGKGGIIVGPEDLKRLAECLALTPERVIDLYGEYSGQKLTIKNGPHGACVFYDKERGCVVHEGKPNVCRAWPFFRGNLVDKESFLLAKEFCPGIPEDLPFEEFIAYGRAYLKRYNLLASDGTVEANALIL